MGFHAEIERTLGLWAADFKGFEPAYVAAAAHQAAELAPPDLGLTGRTALGRWIGLVTWVEASFLSFTFADQSAATLAWRRLRAVAEGRYAPTSPLGRAIAAFCADLRRLRSVSDADSMLLSLAFGELIDGFDQRYAVSRGWLEADPARLERAAALSTGTLGLFATLGAIREWQLPLLHPTHPARRMIAAIGSARAQAAAGQLGPARLEALTLLEQLDSQHAELAAWTRGMLAVWGLLPEEEAFA